MHEDLEQQARAWLIHDPDPHTRAELTALLDPLDEDALRERFAHKLEFGTAGLRGELGAGPNRMNRVTVMRAATGLARVLGPNKHVVIGYDGRHNSDIFARDTATVLARAGLKAAILPGLLPTPVLAFAVRHLGADAGVMVTASHNPPRDNGFKVYWSDGSQIAAPVDKEISAAIDSVDLASQPLQSSSDRLTWTQLGQEIITAYLDAITALPLGTARDLTIAYTPLHGVGAATLTAAFLSAGFTAPAIVEAQATPDPNFPTVVFPNPEEPGAMDLVLELAGRLGADIVLANDPDADRCAVGVALPDGRYRMLTGDEVGGLLAEYVIQHTAGYARLVATTIASSSLLAKIASAHGVRYAETLTGFKWIMKADDGRGPRTLVFGYEEALGYSAGTDAGPPVCDKDGISAALLLAGMAAQAKEEGRTLLDYLDDQARRYGLHATSQLTVRVDNPSFIEGAMARLRAAPPARLGGRAVQAIEDLNHGVGGLPPTEGLRCRLSGDARVVVRPSGTEPKLKCYLEVVIPVTGEICEARARATGDLDAIKVDISAALGL